MKLGLFDAFLHKTTESGRKNCRSLFVKKLLTKKGLKNIATILSTERHKWLTYMWNVHVWTKKSLLKQWKAHACTLKAHYVSSLKDVEPPAGGRNLLPPRIHFPRETRCYMGLQLSTREKFTHVLCKAHYVSSLKDVEPPAGGRNLLPPRIHFSREPRFTPTSPCFRGRCGSSSLAYVCTVYTHTIEVLFKNSYYLFLTLTLYI